MTIYADVLVVVNLYIDFFLLWCTGRFLRLRVGARRILLGAIVGAVISLAALFELPAWAAFLTGVGGSVCVTAASFAPCRVITLVRAAVCFWAASFLLAGFFVFVLRFFSPSGIAVLGGVIYFDISPLLLFVFTCGAYVIFAAAQKLLPKSVPDSRFREFVIENGGGSVKIFAKADTGSNLREPFSGLPVIICERECVKSILPMHLAEGVKTDSEATLQNGGIRLVPFESIGGGGVLPAFKPQRVIDSRTGREIACYIALTDKRLSAGQFCAVFNPDFLEL